MTQKATSAVPDLIPVRMLNEYVYCPRLAYLEWVQGEFEDSVDTIEGRYQHRRVDKPSGRLPDGPQEDGSGPKHDEPEDTTCHARSLMLSDPSLGLISRMDLIEAKGMTATPVDYKRGAVPDVPAGAYNPERVQVCAQGLILRANGFRCEKGVLYYAGSRRRVEVPLDEELVDQTHMAIGGLKAIAASGRIPPPLEDSPKCPRCSLVGICLPDELNLLAHPDGIHEEIRRMAPARNSGLPMHVTEPGAVVRKRGDTLEVQVKGERRGLARLLEISQLNVYGNVKVTTQAMRELINRNISICFFSFGGWFVGIAHGLSHKNIELRKRQFAVAEDSERCLVLAQSFVNGKVRNSRTLLRRNHPAPPEATLRELSRLAKRARACTSLDSLLGIEGAAARAYFAQFSGMLKNSEGHDFDFHSRNRRPPKDPINALLSFLYALLVKELTVVCQGIGLDPFLGFYHQPRYGRPALALDLAEEFRSIIADSVVIMLVNNREVKPSDFVVNRAGAALSQSARRRVLAAYERRVDTLVTHPVFGYPISYRKVMHVQARILARYLNEEIQNYPSFCTR